MDKIYVVYWSQTGNTQAMAEAIGKGITVAGKEAVVVSVENISADELKEANKFALGCPAMGAENLLIEYCAPTLAGIKTANLFTYHFSSEGVVLEELKTINLKLNMRGVFAVVLLWREDSALIYVYRKTKLENELKSEGVMSLLSKYGYIDNSVENSLKYLMKRLEYYECFPHEIGVFLGYPLTDVIGFINHKGKNCKLCGFWKVYSNECEAQKLFEKLKKCTNIYLRLFAEGRSITQMTVAG